MDCYTQLQVCVCVCVCVFTYTGVCVHQANIWKYSGGPLPFYSSVLFPTLLCTHLRKKVLNHLNHSLTIISNECLLMVFYCVINGYRLWFSGQTQCVSVLPATRAGCSFAGEGRRGTWPLPTGALATLNQLVLEEILVGSLRGSIIGLLMPQPRGKHY